MSNLSSLITCENLSVIRSLFSSKQSSFLRIYWNWFGTIFVVSFGFGSDRPLTSSSSRDIYSFLATLPERLWSKNLIQNLIKLLLSTCPASKIQYRCKYVLQSTITFWLCTSKPIKNKQIKSGNCKNLPWATRILLLTWGSFSFKKLQFLMK